MKRYDPDWAEGGNILMLEADDGDWVRFEEYEQLHKVLSEIEEFARGEGDVGNIVARKAAAALRPDTAPPDQLPREQT